MDAAAAARAELERLQTAPLEPWRVDEVRRVLSELPGEAVADSFAALTSGETLEPRLVGPRDDHPALDVVLERGLRLVDEAVPAEAVAMDAVQDARARLATARAALADAATADQARAAREAVQRAALDVEVHGWRLAHLAVRVLAGPLADEALMASLPLRVIADARAVLSEVEPADPDYEVVAKGWRTYRDLADAWKARDEPPPTVSRRWRWLRPGKIHKFVQPFRARLAALGFPSEPEGRADRFDDRLLDTLRAFQRRHGIDDRGRVDGPTLSALAVPPSERVGTLAAVLKHIRTSQARLLPRRVQVNIPAFRLRVFDNGSAVATHKVVVGSNSRGLDPDSGRLRRMNRTPVLYSRIRALVLNPSWYVPQRIKENELDVRAERRPETYDDFELYTDSSGVERARQLPGPGNALGQVKFVFRGGGGVYLHDTPNKRAFRKSNRAISHGCVRVHDALSLAKRLLDRDRGRITWDRARALLHTRRSTPITLREAVPIVIEYVTAGSEDGELRLYRDVYGWGPVRAPTIED